MKDVSGYECDGLLGSGTLYISITIICSTIFAHGMHELEPVLDTWDPRTPPAVKLRKMEWTHITKAGLRGGKEKWPGGPFCAVALRTLIRGGWGFGVS